VKSAQRGGERDPPAKKKCSVCQERDNIEAQRDVPALQTRTQHQSNRPGERPGAKHAPRGKQRPAGFNRKHAPQWSNHDPPCHERPRRLDDVENAWRFVMLISTERSEYEEAQNVAA